MIPATIQNILKKQHYELVGEHSAIQVCKWTKKSLRDNGVCYKERFYGIKSHLCCQMSPSVMWCQNKCLHCWRAIELNLGSKIKKEDSPSEIIDKCILAQRKLLLGFKKIPNSKKKQLSKANMKKWKEAQEPMQFAISLSGEPTIYSKVGELIEELRRRKKTSFLVTNGLLPERIAELKEKNQLPTQLYVSVNVPNKNMYEKFHRSSEKNAWRKLNETLDLLPSLTPQAYTKEVREPLRGPEKYSAKSFTRGKCRTVFRINLIKDFNMNEKCIGEFAKLIKKSQPTFVELKGFMSVGFARQRLGYERMPWHKDILDFAKKLEKQLKSEKYKILDEHEISRAVVMGRDKGGLKIRAI